MLFLMILIIDTAWNLAFDVKFNSDDWSLRIWLSLDKHDIANSTFIFAFSRLCRNLLRSFVWSRRPRHLISPKCTQYAARIARTTVAHRKASTRTPQPQDKPKEGECYAIRIKSRRNVRVDFFLISPQLSVGSITVYIWILIVFQTDGDGWMMDDRIVSSQQYLTILLIEFHISIKSSHTLTLHLSARSSNRTYRSRLSLFICFH